MELSFHRSLDEIPAKEWDLLGAREDPFLRHAFLSALERNDCVGQSFGWYPTHLAVRDDTGRLIGATPLYIKTNSYGELVFDWSWASAYERAGLPYYPKLVAAIPYTPVTGRRLLVHPEADAQSVKALMIRATVALAEEHAFSSIHWLFTDEADTAALADAGMMRRLGCQYHWHNNHYADFDQFLTGFQSRKRKKLKRERRRVDEQGITLTTHRADEICESLLETFHRFYLDTFEKKAGIPTLSLGFFKDIARTMGEDIVLVVAHYEGRPVAGAINFKGPDALYGRYWGCEREFHSLHFETCYYRGIDYSIAQGLQRFEPGAQGEHKIGRGFLPTPTWSAHWIRDARFHDAIEDFCRRELRAMRLQCAELWSLSPFREDALPPSQTPPEDENAP